MESSVESTLNVPIFEPSIEEFKNFSKYIAKLEKNDISFAKIIPPPEFHPHSKRIAGNKLLKPIIQQYKSPIPRTKSFVLCHNGENKMTYASFVKKARDREALFGALTMKEAENKFWSNQHDAYYGIDLSISLFGDECQWWNLSKFTQAESLLHHNEFPRISGIHDPFSYVGQIFSAFGLHLEEGDLNSINYNHGGAPKFWYFIPESENAKLEKLANRFEDRRKCGFSIRHKYYLIPPSVLQKNGIKFARVLQEEGQFVISFSGGYHQGFNLGLNAAEAINFGSKRWLRFFENFKLCSCPHSFGYQKSIEDVAKIFQNLQISDVENNQENQSTEKPFQCDECPLSYKMKKGLMEHKRLKHDTHVIKYECREPMCNAKFMASTLLKQHYKAVHEINKTTAQISIQNAKRERNTKTAKQKYLSKVRNPIKRKILHCEKCGRTASGRYNMNRHMADIHQSSK